MKNVFALTVLSSSMLFASQSFAAPVFVSIDDFNAGAQSISDNTANGLAVTDSNAIRTISSNMLTAVPPVGNTFDVTGVNPGGFVDITNGNIDDSEATISWALAGGLLPSTATSASLMFTILATDGNPTNLAFTFNGNPFGAVNVPGNTSDMDIPISLTAAQVAQVNAGGLLKLIINGTPGWDLSMDNLGFSYEPAANAVPEPASLALIAAGLAGFGFRKKQQA